MVSDNSLGINIIHHNRWKSKMRSVTKVAFAFGLLTVTFSFSNKWQAHTRKAKTRWPNQVTLQTKQEKQKSLPNEVPDLAERSFQNWFSNTCLSCRYCRSRCLGVELSVPFLLLIWPRATPSDFLKSTAVGRTVAMKARLAQDVFWATKKETKILFWALTRCDVSASFKMWRAGEEY